MSRILPSIISFITRSKKVIVVSKVNPARFILMSGRSDSPGHLERMTMKINIVRHIPTWSVPGGILVGCLLLPLPLRAQQAARLDTAHTYSIPEIVVSDAYRTWEVRTTAPTQVFTRAQLQSLNVLQVSDAVKHFAGVTVKDYGGIGGLKTVSLRSLGAEHTTVGYDGIALTDCQTGQIDIGRFSLDNVDRLSLNNGQSDDIFQSARLFASAGILNIQTLTPHFADDKPTNLSASFKTGSWGLINPTLSVEQKLNNKWALSANGEWMSADGHYPYTLYYGGQDDQTSEEKRKNTEVEKLRAEVGLFGNFSDTEQWRLKAYYYQSSRGLPNATTFYYDYASQHLWDKNFFVQSQYKKELSPKWVFQTAAKWNWSYQRYLDPDYKSTSGVQDDSYYQQEYYLSGALLYRVAHRLSFSLAADGSINTLDTHKASFARPTRYSGLTAVAGKYVGDWFTLSGSVLGTMINEEVKQGKAYGNYRHLSPYASIAIKPLVDEDFRLRFFYKESFRLPSFNDLYYGEVGNTNLRPENTRQYNVGVTYGKRINRFVPYLSATVDAYYNRVTDKIIAVPTKNLFIWSMMNLGKVEIKGIDVTGSLTLQPMEKLGISLSGNYTYQQALDMTDPDSKTYEHQIAYTPRRSGSGQAGIETPWVNLSYSFLYVGKRYVLGQNIHENALDGYSDHSLSASRDFRVKAVRLSLNVEVLNLADKNYEVVKNFPMPGRSVRGTLKVVY